MQDITYYTKQGLEKLRATLHKLKTKERKRIADQIAEARDKGDLSENAEYDAAKEAQGLLEMKIKNLEASIACARIISKEEIDTSQVTILTKVTIKHLAQGHIATYTLVSAAEADLSMGKISIESPIGKGLLGKRIGETITINTPASKLKLEILNITL